MTELISNDQRTLLSSTQSDIESKCGCIFNDDCGVGPLIIAAQNGCLSCMDKYKIIIHDRVSLTISHVFKIHILLASDRPRLLKIQVLIKLYNTSWYNYDCMHKQLSNLYPLNLEELTLLLNHHYIPRRFWWYYDKNTKTCYDPKCNASNIQYIVSARKTLLSYHKIHLRQNIPKSNCKRLRNVAQILTNMIDVYMIMRRNLFILRVAGKLHTDTANYIERFISL